MGVPSKVIPFLPTPRCFGPLPASGPWPCAHSSLHPSLSSPLRPLPSHSPHMPFDFVTSFHWAPSLLPNSRHIRPRCHILSQLPPPQLLLLSSSTVTLQDSTPSPFSTQDLVRLPGTFCHFVSKTTKPRDRRSATALQRWAWTPTRSCLCTW